MKGSAVMGVYSPSDKGKQAVCERKLLILPRCAEKISSTEKDFHTNPSLSQVRYFLKRKSVMVKEAIFFS